MAKYPFDKFCDHCSTVFSITKAYNRHQRFCTKICANQASRIRPRGDLCNECGRDISNLKNKTKFCSSSCAAFYNNRLRDKSINQKVGCILKIKAQHTVSYKISRAEIKLLLSSNDIDIKSLGVRHDPYTIIQKPVKCSTPPAPSKGPYIRVCGGCNTPLSNNKKKYCASCYPNIRHYRSLAEFKFNVYDYPAEFDLALIHTHGWFSPNGYKKRNNQPNLNGVSRDHLYTVSDGFKNKVDPAILAHPANCAILVHNGPGGNNSKRKSSITLDELVARIKFWDTKYPK